MSIHSTGFCTSGVVTTTAVVIALFLPAAHAGDVIFDNIAGGGGAAAINNAYISDADNSIYMADNVTLGATAMITGIEWTGAYAFVGTPPPTDDFTITVYGNLDGGGSGGVGPGLELFSFHVGNAVNRTSTAFQVGGLDVYAYSAAIHFVLPATTPVWISITANTFNDDNDNFYWGAVANTGNSFDSADQNAWTPDNDTLDFRLLSDPVPCSADVNGDNVVDTFDLLIFLEQWGPCNAANSTAPATDVPAAVVVAPKPATPLTQTPAPTQSNVREPASAVDTTVDTTGDTRRDGDGGNVRTDISGAADAAP